jgi:hypothetical protein
MLHNLRAFMNIRNLIKTFQFLSGCLIGQLI